MKKVGPLAPLRERPFVLCLTTGALSSSANWMLGLSVPVLIYEITGSVTLVGTAAAAANLPSLLGSPLGGVWADRYSKRLVLALALAMQMSLTGGLYWISLRDSLSVPMLLGLTTAIGFASSVNLSAYQALVAQIVPQRLIRPAYRLNAIQFNLSRAVGPAVAGFVLADWGPSTAFLLNAIAHLPLALVLLLIHPRELPRTAATNMLSEIAAGAKIAWQQTSLRIALITVSMSAFFGMSVQQLAAGLAQEVFHVDPSGLGLLVSAVGIAAVITAILTVWIGDLFRGSLLVRVGLAFYGFGLWIVAATDVFTWGLVGFAITGFAHVLVNVTVTTAVQTYVPEAFRGRVTSLQLMGIILSMAFGAQMGGALGDTYGLPSVVAFYGGALILYGAWGHFRMDGLRALD
ncbi:MAG: MFS transporter [bacterium]|nr:hypothetical protein [Deltaproteobacteria bacterium]MCP4905525.1 MFS transporter [bacterium]